MKFDSEEVYSLLAQRGAKPLDSIIVLGISMHDVLKKGNMGGGPAYYIHKQN